MHFCAHHNYLVCTNILVCICNTRISYVCVYVWVHVHCGLLSRLHYHNNDIVLCQIWFPTTMPGLGEPSVVLCALWWDIKGFLITDFLWNLLWCGTVILFSKCGLKIQLFHHLSLIHFLFNIFVQFHQVPTYKALHEFISKDQLTSEFEGTLSYSHQDWVKFRMVSLCTLFQSLNIHLDTFVVSHGVYILALEMTSVSR